MAQWTIQGVEKLNLLRKSRKVYSFSGMLGMKLIDLHKRYIEWWQRKLGISDYGLLWLSFFKGFLIALLVIWLVK